MKTNKHKRTAIHLVLASVFMLGSAIHVQAQIGNTVYGLNAMPAVTTGNYNSAFGDTSLNNNSEGSQNTASGAFSLLSNTTGSYNTANGLDSLYYNTTGNYNTANGSGSLSSNTTGGDNVASGAYSLYSNTTGDKNTASGYASLYANTTAHQNTAVGYVSLTDNTEGVGNTATGAFALNSNTTGFYNTASGFYSLVSNTEGNDNVAIGNSALYNNTTGSNNLAIGTAAGYENQTGSNNFFMGFLAGFYETGSNKLYISNNGDTPLLYGEMSIVPSENKLGIGTNIVPVGSVVNVWNGASLSAGGVWTNASSRELKENIETLSTEDANEALAALSPVRYVYKNSRDEEYVGFIAEDVPDLVATNDRKSLAPMDIVAVLTTVTKEQTAEIAELKDRLLQMEMTLAEVLRNQSAEIQVSSTD